MFVMIFVGDMCLWGAIPLWYICTSVVAWVASVKPPGVEVNGGEQVWVSSCMRRLFGSSPRPGWLLCLPCCQRWVAPEVLRQHLRFVYGATHPLVGVLLGVWVCSFLTCGPTRGSASAPCALCSCLCRLEWPDLPGASAIAEGGVALFLFSFRPPRCLRMSRVIRCVWVGPD